MDEFDLEGRPFVELHKLLQLAGQCASGGTAKLAIAAGEVRVDGRTERRKRCKVRPGQVVEFGGRTIAVRGG